MTLEELIDKAEELVRIVTTSDMGYMGFEIDEDEFRRVFAELVRADERNECAKVCEELVPDMSRTSFEAAAELRRLHEANQAMLEALKNFTDGCSTTVDAFAAARAAIAKGEQS